MKGGGVNGSGSGGGGEENSVGALELVGCRVEVGVNGCEGVGAVGGWLTKYSGEALHSSVGLVHCCCQSTSLKLYQTYFQFNPIFTFTYGLI